MTVEKAVKILKANDERRIASIYESIKALAIKALEEQIAKKPILKETKCFDGSTDDFWLVCPVCNRTICREGDVIADHIKEEYAHCNCGHALDWSGSKMTDAEIIQSLRACIEENCDKCANCVINFTPRDCKENVITLALDLINRQRAELDELRDVCGKCPMLKSKNNIIDSLKEQIKGWQQGYCELRQELKTAKSEAIKEFAERLKDEFEKNSAYTFRCIGSRIDNLVKEMAGDTE